ncbi:MAG: TolC family protein [Longimicrobiales bacterium]|nr:TolC family protein [Longimicrobiales bacterium]
MDTRIRDPLLALLMAALWAPWSGGAPLTAQEAPARVVSLAELFAAADTGNAEIRAARRTAEASFARVPQAGALPDPTLGLGLVNFPLADPSFREEMMTMTQLQLGARVPWPGRRGLRERAAEARARSADWEVAQVQDRVHEEISTVWARLYYVDRAIEITEENESLLADLTRASTADLSVGRSSQPDVLRAQVERAGLADQLLALRQERTALIARLAALIGDRDATFEVRPELAPEIVAAATTASAPRSSFAAVEVTERAAGDEETGEGPIPSVAELRNTALHANPMLLAHQERVAAQERVVDLARIAKKPDVNFSVAYSYRSGFADFFNFVVSAPLPIFSGRKQDQAVIEEGAVLGQHTARHHQMVDELNAEIATLWSELQRTRDQIALLREGILPQARTALASSSSSYRVGRVDFSTLIDAQVDLYRHELHHHRLLADFATKLAALERAVGTEVLR